MNKSQEIKNIAAALAKAQSEVGSVAFDSVNPHFKSRYASLAAYLDAMVEPFSKHGLSVSSSIEDGEKGMYLSTLLLHSSGEWIEYKTPMILNKNDMQGLGDAAHLGDRRGDRLQLALIGFDGMFAHGRPLASAARV